MDILKLFSILWMNQKSKLTMKLRKTSLGYFIYIGYRSNPSACLSIRFRDPEERGIRLSINRHQIKKDITHALDKLKPPVLHYYEFMKNRMESQFHISAICSDPMNGCPGDFMEDYSRKHRGDEMKEYHLSKKCWGWTKRIAHYFLERLYRKLEEQEAQLPWNQEYEDAPINQ